MVTPFEPLPPSLGDWLALRDDLMAAEVLLQEVEPPLAVLEAYWEASADLLALVADVDERIEGWRGDGPHDQDRVVYQRQRRRLTTLLATINQYPLPSSDEWGTDT